MINLEENEALQNKILLKVNEYMQTQGATLKQVARAVHMATSVVDNKLNSTTPFSLVFCSRFIDYFHLEEGYFGPEIAKQIAWEKVLVSRKNCGIKLRKIRTDNGINQEKAAEVLRVSKTNYGFKETGKVPVDETDIQRLSRFSQSLEMESVRKSLIVMVYPASQILAAKMFLFMFLQGCGSLRRFTKEIGVPNQYLGDIFTGENGLTYKLFNNHVIKTFPFVGTIPTKDWFDSPMESREARRILSACNSVPPVRYQYLSEPDIKAYSQISKMFGRIIECGKEPTSYLWSIIENIQIATELSVANFSWLITKSKKSNIFIGRDKPPTPRLLLDIIKTFSISIDFYENPDYSLINAIKKETKTPVTIPPGERKYSAKMKEFMIFHGFASDDIFAEVCGLKKKSMSGVMDGIYSVNKDMITTISTKFPTAFGGIPTEFIFSDGAKLTPEEIDETFEVYMRLEKAFRHKPQPSDEIKRYAAGNNHDRRVLLQSGNVVSDMNHLAPHLNQPL